MKNQTANTKSVTATNASAIIKTEKTIDNAAAQKNSSASIEKKGKNAKNTEGASAISDRDKIESQLDRQLQQRPSATDLKNRNILKDTNASPALQAAQNELQRLQLGSTLDKKLSQRPEAATLVKQNILQADPSHGTVTKKMETQKNSKSQVAVANTNTNIETNQASKSATTVKKTASKKKNQDSHDPMNLQLVAHDPKDYQLVAHDPKDYRVAIHDEKQMQLIVSPKKSNAHFSNSSSSNNHGNDDFSFNKNVMIDPRTGSPMSHAAMRKHKKLLKLRDSMIEHQNNHIAVPVSNAGILYDPMQSHKMNALVKVPSKTEKAPAAAKSVVSHAEDKQKQQKSTTAVVNKKDGTNHVEAALKKTTVSTTSSKKVAVQEKSTANVRSASPVANASARSVSPAPAQQQQSTTSLKGQQSSKAVAASPQQQPLKMAPSPVMNAKSSAVSIKARA